MDVSGRNGVFSPSRGSAVNESVGANADDEAASDKQTPELHYQCSRPINISPNLMMWPRDDDDDFYR